ncbi:hypothetical protein CB373_00010 [Salmonella enterica subsp. enterica serovar Westminster]|nr:hypothetical protein [Salmonella enterica subsp. enterica serovar Westminster]
MLYSCEPLMASVLVSDIAPAPTLTILRFSMLLPTETVLSVPATELAPIATALLPLVMAL